MGRFTAIVIVLIACLLAGNAVAADTISQIRTGELTKQQFLDLFRLGLDVIGRVGDQFDILVKPADMATLDTMGISYEVTQPDIQAWYEKTRGATAQAMGGFRTLSEIEAYLDSLAAAFPAICTPKFSIGKSFQNRDLWVVKISDNPALDEDEPEVFYNGLIHAREPIGAACVLYFMDYLLTNYGVDPEVTGLVDNREFYFLPVINPDGYYHNQQTDPTGGGMWRKNMRYDGGSDVGVDLNRNFGYKWGFDDYGSSPDPASVVYRGAAPFSEPETQAIRDFAVSRNFVIVHNFHSYSNLFLWPWGYARIYTPQEDFFRVLGDSMTFANGYAPQVSWMLYPTNGGADDWVWGDTIAKPRAISATTEVGGDYDGFWPDPSRIPQLVQENLGPNLFLAKIADNPYRLSPPNRPVVSCPDSSGGDYEVSWHVVDSHNVMASYRLFEMSDKQTVTDDAESEPGYWETQRFVRTTMRKHSGTSSWSAQQVNGAEHFLLSQTPYTVRENDTVKCWLWYALEAGWDYLYVQVSIDGGVTYVNLAGNLTTDSNPNGTNMGNGITGTSSDWVIGLFDLSAYAGQQVLLRFNYVTDSYTLGSGIYIDDIENVDVFGSVAELISGSPDTMIAFASKPDGDYWYRASATDTDNQESRLSIMAHTRVARGWVAGDCTGDGKVNLTDVTFLIQNVYLGGAAPEPFERGDINCDGKINLTDITRVIDHVYISHNPLVCP